VPKGEKFPNTFFLPAPAGLKMVFVLVFLGALASWRENFFYLNLGENE